MERQDDSNPTVEAVKRAGLQGLLAMIPVATWLHHKQTDAVTKVLSEMNEDELLGLRKPAASRAMLQSANKLAMKEPIVLGATIVATSMGHGAVHGYRHAQHAQHDREAPASFRDREDQRRDRQRDTARSM